MKAFLFDLDGTLTDPREGITRSIAYALERLGIDPPPADDLVFAIGPPLRSSLSQLLGSEAPETVKAVMIGDRRVNMHAARHHGVIAMGALWGFGSREELEAHGAQHLCAVPRDLPAALARLHAPS